MEGRIERQSGREVEKREGEKRGKDVESRFLERGKTEE
jgi:hypothetical protein